MLSFYGITIWYSESSITKLKIWDEITWYSLNNLANNQLVNVVIRPEAIKLHTEKSPLLSPYTGVVVDSKFLGNSAIVHMTVNDKNNNKHHIHSKVIGNFLPNPASSLSITLDQSQVFIFPR